MGSAREKVNVSREDELRSEFAFYQDELSEVVVQLASGLYEGPETARRMMCRKAELRRKLGNLATEILN